MPIAISCGLFLSFLGKSNNEIAQKLNITIGTVIVHVHAILQKLEVREIAYSKSVED